MQDIFFTMSTSSIIGYVDPLIVSAGDRVAVKTSCSQPTFTSKLLRILAGHEHPDAPPVAHEAIENIPEQSHQGKLQFSRTGSYICIPSWGHENLGDVNCLSISFWCQATLPQGADHKQFLFSSIDDDNNRGVGCYIDESGGLRVITGRSSKANEISFSVHFTRHQWYHVNISIDRTERKVELIAHSMSADIGQADIIFHQKGVLTQIPPFSSGKPLIIASDSRDINVAGYPVKSGTFNGKIDGFKIETTLRSSMVETLLNLDFSLDIPTDQVRDVSGHNHHGILTNAPARAVTGHDWDASQNDWTRASYGYGAIHFHDDDLDDARWETSFDLQIPPDMRSGCYGVHVDDGVTEDIIPVFVRPDPWARKPPPVALIMPTFAYIGELVNPVSNF